MPMALTIPALQALTLPRDTRLRRCRRTSRHPDAAPALAPHFAALLVVPIGKPLKPNVIVVFAPFMEHVLVGHAHAVLRTAAA